DLVAQPLQLEFTHVDTIDKHTSRARIVETRDQAHYCGLAATRGTDDTYQLAGSDVEVHVAEHWYRGIITEGHVVKGDRAFDGSGIARVRSLRNRGLRVENCLHTLHRNRCLR